jgi:tetratricopeptide (TPR) repeat protein
MCPKPPAPPSHFGGRDGVLQSLKDGIKCGKIVGLFAINGSGGIGKTTIARTLAHQLYAEKVFRSVLWANVTRTPNAVGILRGWITSYADSSFSTENLKEDQVAAAAKGLLENVINDQCEDCEPSRVLVVLDDVWDNGLDAVRLIQSACPENATILITTRSEPLVNNLHAHKEPLGTLEHDDAAIFLAQYLPDASAESLHALGAALGGHALAMELAARRIENEAGRPGQTLQSTLMRATLDYQRGIPAGTPFADLKLESGENREDNLTKALALSYDDLKSEEQCRFRALGVLAYDAPFDQTILAALWETTPDKVDELADTLRLLSLIQVDGTGYRQHPLLRSYALALLRKANEIETTFAHYADQIIANASKFDVLPLEQWGELTPYLPHIHNVGDELVARTANPATLSDVMLKRAQVFAVNTSRYLANRREVRQVDWIEMGLRVSRQLRDVGHEALFLNNLGGYYKDSGDNKQAIEYYQEALSVNSQVGNRVGEAAILTNIGAIFSVQDAHRQAIHYFGQALHLQQALGNSIGEATALVSIGLVYAKLGNNLKALSFYEQALPLQQDAADRRGEATTLGNLGRAHAELGNRQRALAYYEQALSLQRAIGNRSGEAAALNNLGLVYFDMENLKQAFEYYEKALPLRQAVRDRYGEGMTLNNMGLVYDKQGDKQKALTFYQQAMALHHTIGSRSGEALALLNIGTVFYDMDEKHEALKYFEQALNLQHAVGDRRNEATTLTNIGTIYSDREENEKAITYYEQSLVLCRAVGDLYEEANTGRKAGALYYYLGEFGKAVSCFERCTELDTQLQLPDLKGDQKYLNFIKSEWDGIQRLASESLSEKTIKSFIATTIAVKTNMPQSFTQWRIQVQAFRNETMAKGENRYNEMVFGDALLAILGDLPATLPQENPYQPYLQQILVAIDDFVKGN